MKNRHLKSTKQSRSAEYQYLELGKEILANGIEQVDRGTKVKTYSIFGIRHVYDLSESFPLLTTKRVYWNGVIQELYWFLSGQTNIKYLVDHNVHIWDDYPYKIYLEKIRNSKFEIRNSEQRKKKPKQPLSKEEFIDKIKNDNNFARRWGELPHIYGEMWRKWPTKKKGKTVDQLQWVIDEVRADPSAHNLIVNSWNPEYLYTMAEKSEAARFPICHNMYQISNRNGKLDLILYQRSCDYFL
ncbi:MAG: Thymidylate synthase [Candidatus Levybacteria bacterium GW2011_GWC1_40_19]|nr:MAG: Thymidylate synthase [Candidatus Levybacteria bacterium GW2011_GWC1_40_19]